MMGLLKKTLKCREKGNMMDKLMWWVIICSIGIEQAMMYLFPEQRFELTFKNEGYLIACKDVHGTLWNERKWHKCSPTSWVCHQPHLSRNIPHKTFLAHLKHLLHNITLDLRLDLKTVSQIRTTQNTKIWRHNNLSIW
jgi:hypothetical protein